MNDIARTPRSRTNGAALPAPIRNIIQGPPAADTTPPVSDDDGLIHLKWRRLDQLEAAATLGLILVAPRSALLAASLLGHQVPPTTAPSAKDPLAADHRQRAG